MARIGHTETNPASKAPVRRWPLRWKLLFIGLLVLLVCIPAYFGLRHWRAGHLVAQAEALHQQSDSEAAWERIRAARQLFPQNLEMMRKAANIAERVDVFEAGRLYRLAAEASGNAAEDLIGQIKVSLTIQNWTEADRILEQFKEIHGERVDYLLWRTRWHSMRGEMVMATRLAGQLLVHKDSSPEHHWIYVEIALNSPRQVDNFRARQHLRDLALSQQDRSLARQALRRFCELSDLTEGERDFAIRRWGELAEDREDQLLALSLRLQQPDVVEERIISAATALFALGSPEERMELARWFNRQQRYQAALEIVPQDLAMTRRDLFLIRLDALAMLDRWREVQQHLSQSRAPLQPYLEELFRMRSFYETGDLGRARIAWERALQAARREPAQLRFLAQYTSALGLYDYTLEALWLMVDQSTLRRSAYEGLLAIHESRRDTREVLRVLERMRQDYPYDHAVLNDWAYYSLLREQQIDEAIQLTEQLIELNPDLLSHRMTRVLGHVQKREWQEALDLVESLPVADWTRIESSRWRALLAVVLARHGRFQEADIALRNIQVDRLVQEERDLLSASMRQ